MIWSNIIECNVIVCNCHLKSMHMSVRYFHRVTSQQQTVWCETLCFRRTPLKTKAARSSQHECPESPEMSAYLFFWGFSLALLHYSFKNCRQMQVLWGHKDPEQTGLIQAFALTKLWVVRFAALLGELKCWTDLNRCGVFHIFFRHSFGVFLRSRGSLWNFQVIASSHINRIREECDLNSSSNHWSFYFKQWAYVDSCKRYENMCGWKGL